MTIRKAVIAVAGFGTRMLPATKSQPKEMLPIVNKPVVQYLVEEAVESGIEDIILVLHSGSPAIAQHFDSAPELEAQLTRQKNDRYLEMVQAIPRMANLAFVWQGGHLPYGNGTPLLAARRFLTPGEPFVYMFGDDLVLSDKPCVRQLMDVYEDYQPSAVIAVQDVAPEDVRHYGIVKTKPGRNPLEMESIVEKPEIDEAPSTLAQFGRFILPPNIVDLLDSQKLGKQGELWLADALDTLCHSERVLVHAIEGTWYTMGDALRYLIANVEYALRNPEVGKKFADYLRTVDLSPEMRDPLNAPPRQPVSVSS